MHDIAILIGLVTTVYQPALLGDRNIESGSGRQVVQTATNNIDFLRV